MIGKLFVRGLLLQIGHVVASLLQIVLGVLQAIPFGRNRFGLLAKILRHRLQRFDALVQLLTLLITHFALLLRSHQWWRVRKCCNRCRANRPGTTPALLLLLQRGNGCR
uniref:Putative secreted peptide n=1 Tax=Anopheles braziliensis TaxID=58242 RepID=A0A2M3ZRU8_9DIPT